MQASRIALGFRRNRLHPELVYLSVRERRNNNRKSEFLKKCSPKRIVFIHIKNTRNPLFRRGLPLQSKAAHSRTAVFVYIQNIFDALFFPEAPAKTAFAAVSVMPSAAGNLLTVSIQLFEHLPQRTVDVLAACKRQNFIKRSIEVSLPRQRSWLSGPHRTHP